MRTAAELVILASETISLWLRFFTRMGFWFCAGWTVHALTVYLSVLIGAKHNLLATLLFVTGVIASVVALVLMVHACQAALGTGSRLPAAVSTAEEKSGLRTEVFTQESRLQVLAAVLGPFLAVYALWGLVEEEVRDLFFANIVLQGLGGVDNWSINLQRIRFYLAVAVVSWVLRQAVARLSARFPIRWLLIPGTLLEGLWVFTSFITLFALGHRVADWLKERVLWSAIIEGWQAFIRVLPEVSLPLSLTLPEAVQVVLAWFWQTLLPGVSTAVLLPLMWLALTATVFGCRTVSERQLVAGTRVGHTAQRFAQRFQQRTAGSAWLAGQRSLSLITNDFRTKYLPVAQGLRLIWRAGPRFLGAYLVLATLVNTLRAATSVLIDVTIGPRSFPAALMITPFTTLVIELLFTTMSVALYVAAFNRAAVASAGTRSAPGRWTAEPEMSPERLPLQES